LKSLKLNTFTSAQVYDLAYELLGLGHTPFTGRIMNSFFLHYTLIIAMLLAGRAQAQQAQQLTRPLIVSPIVGPLIDAQEKATYGLFPTISANDFQEARFERSLSADSATTLYMQLRDGRVVLRPFTPAEVEAVRTTIENRKRELANMPTSATPAPSLAPTDSIGRRYRVTLRTGTTFDGELMAKQPQKLEFLTKDLGVVQIERANILRLEELTSALAKRPANWFDIGNGNRLFFQPTARNLRRGEGSLQLISLYLLGANYGVTENVSVGVLTSVVPFIPLSDQLIAITPKVATKLSDSWYGGAGLLYLRVAGETAGIVYGNTTLGSADNNLTLGLGYGFISGEVGNSPVIQLGWQTRVSRRVSLVNENYFLTSAHSGLGGLYGVKINWQRTSLGLAGAYALSYDEMEGGSTYIVPVYIDFTFRFGKPAR
jgi:hypothetical protein